MSDNFCALREPILDLISVVEKVTDALDCNTGNVGCGFIHLSISLEYLSLFELFLDLFSGSDKCDTIDGCHNSLFDHFSGHFAFQALCDLDVFRSFLVFDVPKDVL